MDIELFPCSGGMAEGFRRAGVVFDLAIDHDPDAVVSYEKNHGHRPLQMDVHDFAKLVRDGWRPAGAIDLLVADPPCTPWSRAGKREGLEDERDCLHVTAELIQLLRPRAYLIGNVPGLQDATQWHVVQEVIGGLRAHGYCVVDYAQLDAADYGVPQHRIRPFWYGHLDGPCLRWPAPTHGPPTTQIAIGGEHLLPWVTCRQALSHLPLEELGRPVRMKIRPKGADGTKHGGDKTRCSDPDSPAKTVVARRFRKGGQILIPGTETLEAAPAAAFVPNGGDTSLCSRPDEPARTVMAHEGVKGGGVLIPNDHHPVSTLDAPAKTVTGGRANRGAQGGRALLVGSRTMPSRDMHPASEIDRPSRAIVSSQPGNGSSVMRVDGHPAARPETPSPTIRGGGRGHSAPQAVLAVQEVIEHPRHPVTRADEPAFVIKANGGRAAGNGTIMRIENPNMPPAPLDAPHRTIGTTEAQPVLELPQPMRGARVGGPDRPGDVVTAEPARVGAGPGQVLDWPWNRPSTTIARDERIPPPGHHAEDWEGGILSGPNAVVVLTERAAAILQGFPEGWLFSGETKRARWAQIGMAMPPGLAEAVARAVVEQQQAARAAPKDRSHG